MITDVVEYKNNWYSYTETCDNCNSVVALHISGSWRTSEKPDINKKSYCYNCLSYKIDTGNYPIKGG